MTHTPDENSDFTSFLDLELAPNGSFEDTWDTLINDNLDLIDAGIEAAGGRADIIYLNQDIDTNLPAATSNIWVRLDPADGKWYKTDASTPEGISGTIGYVTGWYDDAERDYPIQISGRTDFTFSTLAPKGKPVYLSATPGEETLTPPANARIVGYGLADNHIWIVQSVPSPAAIGALAVPTVVPLSADTELTGSNPRIVLVDTTSEDIAITLPAASTCTGQTFVLKKSAPSAATFGCQFTAASGETIDGAGSTSLITVQYGTVRVISDGSVWWTI